MERETGEMVNETKHIDQAHLRLSAVRALLGAVGEHVLGVSVDIADETLEMMVFCQDGITEDEREAMDVALTEILADVYPVAKRWNLQFIENAQEPFEGKGYWIFLRLGCTVMNK